MVNILRLSFFDGLVERVEGCNWFFIYYFLYVGRFRVSFVFFSRVIVVFVSGFGFGLFEGYT